jgi:hypothetical protein
MRIGSRDAVLAICANWRIDFAQAEDCLLARRLQGAGGGQYWVAGAARKARRWPASKMLMSLCRCLFL